MKKITEYELNLTYICPQTKEKVIVEVTENDLSSTVQGCDMCGSHGGIGILIN